MPPENEVVSSFETTDLNGTTNPVTIDSLDIDLTREQPSRAPTELDQQFGQITFFDSNSPQKDQDGSDIREPLDLTDRPDIRIYNPGINDLTPGESDPVAPGDIQRTPIHIDTSQRRDPLAGLQPWERPEITIMPGELLRGDGEPSRSDVRIPGGDGEPEAPQEDRRREREPIRDYRDNLRPHIMPGWNDPRLRPGADTQQPHFFNFDPPSGPDVKIMPGWNDPRLRSRSND